MNANPTFSQLLGSMVLFVLAGVPLVAYLWETLNEVMALEAAPVRLAISVPVLLIFLGLLHVLRRYVHSWTGLTRTSQ
jgi:hypothetical protein